MFNRLTKPVWRSRSWFFWFVLMSVSTVVLVWEGDRGCGGSVSVIIYTFWNEEKKRINYLYDL